MIALFALLACGSDTVPPAVPAPVEPAAKPALAAEPAPTPLSVGAFALGDVPAALAKDVVEGLRFTDANGDNLFVMAASGVPDLTATHVVLKEGAVASTLRTVRQPKGDCDLDYDGRYVKGSAQVTDLDGDGYGEITFAYKFACRGDVSPLAYRVLVIENGEKSILRGSEILVNDKMDLAMEGDGTFVPEGFEGKAELLAHAQKVWKAHVEHPFGQ
jgi:hypothetical protein